MAHRHVQMVRRGDYGVSVAEGAEKAQSRVFGPRSGLWARRGLVGMGLPEAQGGQRLWGECGGS